MIDFSKFKIEVHTNRITPVVQDNPALCYIHDKDTDELFVKLFYNDVEIAQGIILDFYKEFTNIETNGIQETQIKTFPFHDRTKQKYTNFGNKIYQIKYLQNPPIPQQQRMHYIAEFTNAINHYLPSLKEINESLKITFVPSSTKTPDDIATSLSNLSSLDLANIISKNSQSVANSKNILDFNTSIQYAQKKYIVDTAYLESHKGTKYIVVDDVFGNESSILTVMKKLYDTTHMLNYFFIVVKDVKR